MYTVPSDKVIYNFTPDIEPVLTVPNDSIVHFEANDCFSQQVRKESDVLQEIDQDRLNPATGPVYVEDAAPGDVLQVEILAIEVQDFGCSAVVPGMGILTEEAEEAIVRIIETKDGQAHYKGMQFPLNPMIGVIGVAPKDGVWPTATPWKHGGNMDTTDIIVGSKLYLPIAQEGALFALGDCHAVMGDGEVCFTGLEIPADVYVRLRVIKNRPMVWPCVETKEELMVIGSGEDLEESCKNSLSPLVAALAKAHNISWEEAYIMASLVVDIKISQLVNPKLTTRAAISRHYLTAAQYLLSLPRDK